MRRALTIFAVLAPLLLLCSCAMRFQYDGDRFPETSGLTICSSPAELPQNCVLIGRATVTADESCSDSEIKDYLLSKARKNGADAVLLHRCRLTPEGTIRADQAFDEATESSLSPIGADSEADMERMEESFDGAYGQAGVSEKRLVVYKKVLKAKFYKLANPGASKL